MPILRGTATFARFQVELKKSGAKPDWKNVVAPALQSRPFTPLVRTEEEERSVGFVELEDHDAQEFSPATLYQGEWALFSWRVDEFRIPAFQMKSELERWSKSFELENERPPGRKEKLDAKQVLRQTLKATAPIVTRTFDVSWNLNSMQLYVWAASRTVVEEIQDVLEQALDVKLRPLVPVVMAELLGHSDKSLMPTPALSMPEKEEVPRG